MNLKCLMLFLVHYFLISDAAVYCSKFSPSYAKPDLQLSRRDLENCLSLIGRNPMDKTVAENIWKLIKTVNNGIDGIPIHYYKNMGWSMRGIPVDDLRNITLDRGDLIEIFGSAKSLSDEQMAVVAEKVREEWANKTPEKYSEYDLNILGSILCYFNQSEILRIHPDAYKGAAESIGKLHNCPPDILQSLATLAMQPNAFGQPSRWSKMNISQIGIVVTGLSEKDFLTIKRENLVDSKRFYKQLDKLNKTSISMPN